MFFTILYNFIIAELLTPPFQKCCPTIDNCFGFLKADCLLRLNRELEKVSRAAVVIGKAENGNSARMGGRRLMVLMSWMKL